MPRKKKPEEESEKIDDPVEVEGEPEEDSEEEAIRKSIIMLPPIFDMFGSKSEKKIRALSMIGDVDEERASDLIYGMLSLRESGKIEELSDPEDPSSDIVTTCEPIEIICSTHGGNASEMFGIYDMMRHVRGDCEIHTVGVGKVMSAGVLILAAGTKGKRRIGRHCRVMIHSVVGGTHGAMHNLENEMDEIRWIQDQYIEAIVRESDMTKRMVRKMLDRKVNVYLTAEQAVEYGIADEVF